MRATRGDKPGGPDVKSKSEMLRELETMLNDVFAARAAGTSHPRMARAQGYVDGYMKAMLEMGMANQKELLCLVARQREKVDGPATLELQPVEAVA